ncbi:MAG: response regulator [Leptolyngbyaceae bacterium]|nr:response regulator [Leptolyngbyaceae bacterium]
MRILLVEDDDALRSLLTQRLRAEKYAVDAVSDGQQGKDYALAYQYDLLILDVMLPQLDGISLCKILRAQEYTLPIMLLTAQDSRRAKLTGWDAGVDDYVLKPFDEEELVARVRALLRRNSMNPLPTLTWGPLWLDTNTSEVSYGGQTLALTTKEYTLLEMMLRDSQHVFSNEDIIEGLWTSEEFPTEATVRSHVRRLRQKLATAGAPTDLIATSHGRGYYLKPVEGSTTNTSSTPSSLSQPSSNHQCQGPRGVVEAEPNPWPMNRSVPVPSAYTQFLQKTWEQYRDSCLQKVELLLEAIAQLDPNGPNNAQTDAHQLAHTLSGTLGTFQLDNAMHLARQIEQNVHPDLRLDAAQVAVLRNYAMALKQDIETAYIGATLGMPPNASVPPIRLMLVDDDPIFLKTMQEQLHGYGFEVSILDTPQEFWPVFKNVVPSVLVLDVQMPAVNGLELCQTLRLAPEWQKLPVMFLSIFADMDTQNHAFAVGADDYLIKPITAQKLSDRIRQRLQRIQAVSV